jgi:hypothetical protein
MTITNISVVGIPSWTGAATPYIHVNDLNGNNKYLSMVVFLQQKYLLLPFKSLTCIYGVAAPVHGGIPTIEIFVIAI